MTVQDDLASRYGAPSRRSRLAVGTVAAVVVALALGWLAWATASGARPQASSQLVGFEIAGEHRVEATVRTELDDGVQARCVLRAYAEDHSVVGELAFEPTAGTTQVTQQVRTERRATAVEMLGCTTPDQPRPR